VLVPSEPPSPDRVYEQTEVRDRVRQALAKLPARERRIVSLYYFGEATMKQIGEEIGVNESRVSQLHARAIDRLRKVMTAGLPVERPKLVPKPTRPKFIRTAAKKTGKIGTPRLVA
jgi:DNA-directed RNA polymerase specialized sigma24 family protein